MPLLEKGEPENDWVGIGVADRCVGVGDWCTRLEIVVIFRGSGFIGTTFFPQGQQEHTAPISLNEIW